VSPGSGGRCRQALISDVPRVAFLHLDAFKGFFLTELGYRFVCVMYRAFLANPAGLFVVHETEDGQVTGFAVGALSSGQRDRWIALRFIHNFLWASLPLLFLRPGKIFMRLAARFFETDCSFPVSKDAVVLRSIGVLTSQRGSGTASSLLRSFEEMALERGATSVYLTTDQDKNDRAQNFYKRHGYEVAWGFKQDGRRPMWVMFKLLRNTIGE